VCFCLACSLAVKLSFSLSVSISITLAFLLAILPSFSDIHPCFDVHAVVTIEVADKLLLVGHLKSGGADQTEKVSVYV